MNPVRIFLGRLISQFGDVTWPQRSPDLTAPDFLGVTKMPKCLCQPHSVGQVKNNLREVIQNISPVTYMYYFSYIISIKNKHKKRTFFISF